MNATLLLVAAQSVTPAPPSSGGISLQAAFLGIVAVALIFAIRSLGKLSARIEDLEHAAQNPAGSSIPREAPSKSAVIPPAAAAADAGASDAVPDEIATVIAAAVHVAFGSRARIAAVTPVQSEDRVWSLEGRRQIFHSHKIR